MSQSSPPAGSGRWVVAFIVLAGVVGAAIAYAWWSGQQASWRQQGVVPNKDAAGSTVQSESAAAQEVRVVADHFTDAVEQHKPIEPIRDAALRLVERYPQAADARQLYGQTLLALQQKDAAYEQFTLSLQIDPRQPEVEILAGSIAEERGDIDKALYHYHQAVSITPGSARYRTFLGNAYLAKGEKSKARETLLEAITLDSTHHKAYGVLSQMFAEEGKLQLALEQVDKAIANAPLSDRADAVKYIRSKANLLRRANRPDEALQVLTSELIPDEQMENRALTDIATTWGMLNQPAKAAEAYEAALTANPTRWELLVDAARWRLKANDAAVARQHIDALRRLQPNHPALSELLDGLAKLGTTVDDAAQWR